MLPLPENIDLPFFAYGVFKENEIAYPQISEYVDIACPAHITGYKLYEKDGMAVIAPEKHGRVHGSLVKFFPENKEKAYAIISEFELDEVYEWKEVNNQNILCLKPYKNKYPVKSCNDLQEEYWTSSSDFYFCFVMSYLYNDFKSHLYTHEESNSESEYHFYFYMAENAKTDPHQLELLKNAETFLNLEKNFMLIYSVLNRYSSFAYGNLNDENTGKNALYVNPLCFTKLVNDNCNYHSQLNNATPADKNKYKFAQYYEKPHESKKTDSNENLSKKCAYLATYLKTIRNNCVHRGKNGNTLNFQLLRDAFLDIYYSLYMNLFSLFKTNDQCKGIYDQKKYDEIMKDYKASVKNHNPNNS